MKRSIVFSTVAVFLTACQVEYHPYDTRIDGQTGINARNIARIEAACEGKRTIRFAQISDTQRWYDETEDAVKAINARDDIDFVIHTGDMADFGLRDEFERQRDILDKLQVPYVVLLGNHDCLATGERIFTKIFGAVDFAFTAGNVRFVCLNTNALEFDHDTPVPNFDFIERQIADFPAGAEKSVVAMHAKPYSEQFDNNLAKIFQRMIRQFPALQFCLNGHGHNFAAEDLFDDGVIYYECDNIGKENYLLFTITEEGYDYERVEF
ncbi:metallophosphoesterase [Bacteroides sp. f07]|uniref:metallophosphoesterase family protein n=1 Tax=Bacteroides sp. f07 TaxID=3132704 RepID=UPI0034A7EF14